MATISRVGTAFLVGSLGLAAGAEPPAGNDALRGLMGAAAGVAMGPMGPAIIAARFAAEAPTGQRVVGVIAGTAACIFYSQIAPTPAPQGSEMADQPPSTKNYCVIPTSKNGEPLLAKLEEPACTALRNSHIESDSDMLAAFDIFIKTQGINPLNRWEGGVHMDPNWKPITGEDFPLRAMWGIGPYGNPMLAIKFTMTDSAKRVHDCVAIYYQNHAVVGRGGLRTQINPFRCDGGVLESFANREVLKNFLKLLEGQEINTYQGTLKLAEPATQPADAAPASVAEVAEEVENPVPASKTAQSNTAPQAEV